MKNYMNSYRRDNKGFTLIELLVVMAIIGILVLLGAPRIMGYTQRAELRRIQNDVKVAEDKVEELLVDKTNLPNDWEDMDYSFLETLGEMGEIYTKSGVVGEDNSSDKTVERASYKLIPEDVVESKVSSRLGGDFYANDKGKVYYGGDINMTESLIESGYIPVATTGEFRSINRSSDENRIFGRGTEWEGEYVPGPDKKYVQVADIYFPESHTNISIDSFSGVYNGNGYTINNLTKNASTTVALFNITQEGSIIENVGLVDADISGVGWSASLVSQNRGTIKNSYVTGRVNTTSYYGGGLVGANYGDIINSHSKVTLTASDRHVGGLVGTNLGRIKNSYSSGIVSAPNHWGIGGLAGINSGEINGSYTEGTVRGESEIGGLVGVNSGTIRNSYSKALVRATRYPGGLIGGRSGVIENSYAIGELSGRDHGGLAAGDNSLTVINSYTDKSIGRSKAGEQKSTEELQQQSTFKDWDFDNIWQIKPGEYPTLQWQK